MKSNRLIIASEVFYPDQTTTAHILSHIACHLSTYRDVVVICGPTSYEPNATANNVELPGIERVRIKRISDVKLDKNNLLLRTIRFLTLTSRLTRSVSKEVEAGDDVLIVTNPAPFLVGMSMLKCFKKFNLSIIVHDVFPENTIPAGIFKSVRNPIYRFIQSVFNKAYAKADRLIVLGRDMQAIMQGKLNGKKHKPQIAIVENWADADSSSGTNIVPNADSDKIRILYAGNIGRVQGLDSFVDIVLGLSNESIEFTLRGSGARLPALKAKVANYHQSRIIFGGPFSKSDQFNVMAGCDFALVTLSSGMYGLGVPSKTYNILQAGKPIIYIGHPNSEIALMIKENGIGYCFGENEKGRLVDFLNNLGIQNRPQWQKMGLRAKDLAQKTYSIDNIMQKYENLFIDK